MTIFKTTTEAQTICPNFDKVYAPLSDAWTFTDLDGRKPRTGYIFLWFHGSSVVNHPAACGYDHLADWTKYSPSLNIQNEEIVLEVRQSALCTIADEHPKQSAQEIEKLPRYISEPFAELQEKDVNKAGEVNLFYISRNGLKTLQQENPYLRYNESEGRQQHRRHSWPAGWAQGLKMTRGSFTCVIDPPQ